MTYQVPERPKALFGEIIADGKKKKFKKAEKGGGAKKQRGEKCTIEAEVFGARSTTVSKETYNSVKRDLQQCQKSPTTVSKETYYSVKRDLLQCQKRPTTVSNHRG